MASAIDARQLRADQRCRLRARKQVGIAPAAHRRPLVLCRWRKWQNVIRVVGNLDNGFTSGQIRISNTVFGGAGNDDISAIADTTRAAFAGNFVENTIDGGAGDDHIVAVGKTAFLGENVYAYNIVNGGDGRDVIEASVLANSLS